MMLTDTRHFDNTDTLYSVMPDSLTQESDSVLSNTVNMLTTHSIAHQFMINELFQEIIDNFKHRDLTENG